MNALKTKKLSAALPFLYLILSALMGLCTAMINLLGANYIELNLKQNAKDVYYAGTQIWNLHYITLMLSVVLLVCGIIALVYQFTRKRALPVWVFCALPVLGIVLCLTVIPFKNEFQVRTYSSEAESAYFLISPTSDDFIDGNDNQLMGKNEHWSGNLYFPLLADGSEDYQHAEYYQCPEKNEYWFGYLSYITHFLPVLLSDKAKQHQLYKTRCKLGEAPDH